MPSLNPELHRPSRLHLFSGVFLLILLLLQGCAASNTHRLSSEEVDAVFQNGLRRFQAKDYATAVRRFQTVRDVRPDYPKLQHYMGLSYAKLGLGNFAIEALELAVKQEPKNVNIRMDLAVAFQMMGLHEEALPVYLDLLDIAPDDPRVRLNLGLLYLQQFESPTQGKHHLERYLELAPNSPEAASIRRWMGRREAREANTTAPLAFSGAFSEPPQRQEQAPGGFSGSAAGTPPATQPSASQSSEPEPPQTSQTRVP